MTVCIVSDESRKEALIRLCDAHCAFLCRHRVRATPFAAAYVTELTGKEAGILIGDFAGACEQVSLFAASGECDAVVILRDAADRGPNASYAAELLRICDLYGIPAASGPASAELLLRAIARNAGKKW